MKKTSLAKSLGIISLNVAAVGLLLKRSWRHAIWFAAERLS